MAEHEQKIFDDEHSSAISVIIPMYNVEKYVGDALDSLLAQTFQNFELIVVDDGSTDNSRAVVESYAEKFGGRLKLSRIKHSGGATEPRNMGINLSRGEYLYFMDSDDVITPTALEELYTHAKNFNADVVECEKMYGISYEDWLNPENRKNLKPSAWPAGDKIFITKPTLLTEDLAQRAVDFCKRWLTWNVCIQLIRRDFIAENNLRFVGLTIEDLLFTMCEICSAKRYLVVPNVVFIHRGRKGSFLWRDNNDVEKFLRSRMISIADGVRYLDEYLNGIEAFANRPDLKVMLFDMFTQDLFDHLMHIYSQVPMYALDAVLRKEFSAGDNVALSSFVFSKMNIFRLQLFMAQRRIAELETALNARS